MKWLLPVCVLACACKVDPAGYLLGVPVGVTTTAEPAIRVKLPGFGPYEPATATLAPFDRLPGDLLGPNVTMGPGDSPFLATSMGLEVLTVTMTAAGEAVLEVGLHGWTAIAFTVNGAALGNDPLSPGVQNALDRGEIDRSVFGWCLPMSEIEGLTIEKESVRLMAPDALGLEPGDGIDAMDMHMALYHSDLLDYAHHFTTSRLTSDMWVYFTLRPQFLATVVAQQSAAKRLATHWQMSTVDSSTIYMTQWSGGSWTTPIVYRTWEALGLSAWNRVPIDGLAIDAVVAGTPDVRDTILFSLAGPVPLLADTAAQILHASPSAAPGPPRRVRTRLPTGGYGSLGQQLGAGVGVGDFCTGDPVGRFRQASGMLLLDDFFVARRLGPPPPTAAGLLPAPRGKLALASSAYRIRHRGPFGEVPGLRSCMSWPRHGRGARGTAEIHWGTMADYQGGAGSISWTGSMPIPYEGKPLSYDLDLPKGGLLRRVGAPAPRPEETTKAFVTQWFLEVDGRLYRSPICVMRY
ncbi:MAG: hypothetical protein WAT39_04495 [Planctomycetota bacterium]